MLSGNTKHLWSCITLGFPFSWCEQQSLPRWRWPWQQGLLNLHECLGWGLLWWGGMNGPVIPFNEPAILEVHGLWMFGMACLIPPNFINCIGFCIYYGLLSILWLMVSSPSPLQCGGLMNENDGGPVPSHLRFWCVGKRSGFSEGL